MADGRTTPLRQRRASRRAGDAGTRLVLAISLAAAVVVLLEAVATTRVAADTVLAETRARVAADAFALAEVAASEPDGPWEGARRALVAEVARPDVLSATLIDAAGLVRASVPPAQGPAGVESHAMADGLLRGTPSAPGGTAAGSRGGALVVQALTTIDAEPVVLEVVLRGDPPAARSAALRLTLLLMSAAGAVGVVVLAMAFGGRGVSVAHRRAVMEAATDELTGLGSRRAFARDLARAVDRAGARLEPLAVAVLDISGLEDLRDVAGRDHVESQLVRVAALIRTGREGDSVYRVAGDGFALILRGTTHAEAEAVAWELRRLVATQAAPLAAHAGVAELGERCPDAETLLIGAEAALAEAREREQDGLAALDHDDPWDIRWLLGPGAEQD